MQYWSVQRNEPPLTVLRGIWSVGAKGSKLPSRVPPRGSVGTQQGFVALGAASGACRSVYQSVVHSQTLPVMSCSP